MLNYLFIRFVNGENVTPKWNPTIKTLVRNLELIKNSNPAKMDSLPLCHSLGYKWAWIFKDKGLLRIKRSTEDGRCHLTWLTDEGHKLLTMLQKIQHADFLACHRCGELIDKFFKVSNKEWKQVTGDAHDQVICKSCYNKLKNKQVRM